MARNLYKNTTFLIFILSCFILAGNSQNPSTSIDLQANFPTPISLKANSSNELTIQGLSPSIGYVLLQVHTQDTPVVLSLTPRPVAGYFVRGSSIGVVAITTDKNSVGFYLNSSQATHAIVMAITYDKNSPIPGACNMEFPLEMDPNLHLTWDKDQITLSFQFADVSTSTRGRGDRCEQKPFQSKLSYDVYQYFLPNRDWNEETYIQTIKNFMTTNDILQKATKVKTIEFLKKKTELKFAAYQGQGVMFAVIVRQANSTSEAAYVPISTYTCQFIQGAGCQNKDGEPIQIIMCVLAAFGLLLCLFGHRLFNFSMFSFGMLAASLVAYILISRFTDVESSVVLVLTGVCGVVGGVLWLILWCFVGVPVISVLLAGLVAGFIISAATFNLTPLGQLDIFEVEFNYAMSFSCGILIIPVILLAFTKKLSLLSCTLVGSFLMVAAADAFLKSYITYLVLNAVRKGSVKGFVSTIATYPVQLPGVLLLVAWGVLVLLGLILQTYSTRDHPDFPACPWDRYKERQQRQRQMEQLASRSRDDERRPLLADRGGRRRTNGPRLTASAPQFQETPPREGYQGLVDPL